MSDELAELRRPFPATAVEWKPGVTTGDKKKAMAMAYIDARAVMDRLDHVFALGWSDSYREVPGGMECTITINGTSRSDVGEAGDGPMGRGPKALYSAALKRAANQYGVGRYLYDLPGVWVEYDGDRKRLTEAAVASLNARYTAWLGRAETKKLYGAVLAHGSLAEEHVKPEGEAPQEGTTTPSLATNGADSGGTTPNGAGHDSAAAPGIPPSTTTPSPQANPMASAGNGEGRPAGPGGGSPIKTRDVSALARENWPDESQYTTCPTHGDRMVALFHPEKNKGRPWLACPEKGCETRVWVLPPSAARAILKDAAGDLFKVAS